VRWSVRVKGARRTKSCSKELLGGRFRGCHDPGPVRPRGSRVRMCAALQYAFLVEFLPLYAQSCWTIGPSPGSNLPRL
jgi:hypothetical protein